MPVLTRRIDRRASLPSSIDDSTVLGPPSSQVHAAKEAFRVAVARDAALTCTWCDILREANIMNRQVDVAEPNGIFWAPGPDPLDDEFLFTSMTMGLDQTSLRLAADATRFHPNIDKGDR
jgi:hypothetical protein